MSKDGGWTFRWEEGPLFVAEYAGFLEIADIDLYESEIADFIRRGPPAPYDLLFDLSASPPQRDEVSRRMARIGEDIRRKAGGRAAFVVAVGLMRLQHKRLLEIDSGMRYFESDREARSWLRECNMEANT